MVALFGTNDKVALTVFVVAVVVLVGAGVGLLARRSMAAAIGVILAIVGVGLLASMRLAGSTVDAASLVSAAIQAGLGDLRPEPPDDIRAGRGPRAGSPATTDAGAARRSFLVRAGVLGGLAIVGGGLGRRMLDGRAAQVATAATEIPPAVDPVPAPGPDASFAIDGLTPLIVPNADFYRIDTALITPAVELSTLDAAGVRHGRPRGHADLRRPGGAAADRALRDHRLRQQRGRRRPRRQREVDGGPPLGRARHGGRPARGDAARARAPSTAGPRASRRPG